MGNQDRHLQLSQECHGRILGPCGVWEAGYPRFPNSHSFLRIPLYLASLGVQVSLLM
uniref:Uncharacterized protein n=1 Tax=Anguilla anguilla TaxID=7936 RepID=A0A0E9TWB8_ANGAN